MQYLNLRPSQVILDPENPRLPDGTTSDREAINRLLDEGAESLNSLARDIAKTGQTNPAEIPIAIKEGNRYLIVEGNRRFAALKLLKDPTLANNPEHQKMFKRAALLGSPPARIFTLVVANRAEAEPWIFLRHTGENSGVGTKRWSAGQIATHRRRLNQSIDSGTLRAIVVADSLEESYPADDGLMEVVRRVRREKLTNIGRFFSPDVLTALQFSIEDDSSSLGSKTLYACHTAAQLRDFFFWAFTYIQDHSVDAYKNKAIRQEVLRSAGNLLPNWSDTAPEPFRLADRVDSTEQAEENGLSDGSNSGQTPRGGNNGGSEHDQLGEPGASSGGSSSQSGSGDTVPSQSSQSNSSANRRKIEAKPERYLLQGLRLPNQPERIQRLLAECRTLEIDTTPGLACVMLRVLVELCLSSPNALRLSGASEGSPLKDKILRMLRFLDPDIENPRKRDKALDQAFTETSEMGVQYLNSFVHNWNVRPDPHLARRFSSAYRPFLERIDEKL